MSVESKKGPLKLSQLHVMSIYQEQKQKQSLFQFIYWYLCGESQQNHENTWKDVVT